MDDALVAELESAIADTGALLVQARKYRHAADGALGVHDVGRLRGGLVPLVEDAAEQADGEVLRGRQDLGPVGVQLLQGVLLDSGDGLLITHVTTSFEGGGLGLATWLRDRRSSRHPQYCCDQ